MTMLWLSVGPVAAAFALALVMPRLVRAWGTQPAALAPAETPADALEKALDEVLALEPKVVPDAILRHRALRLSYSTGISKGEAADIRRLAYVDHLGRLVRRHDLLIVMREHGVSVSG